jgi:hypothetical protein
MFHLISEKAREKPHKTHTKNASSTHERVRVLVLFFSKAQSSSGGGGGSSCVVVVSFFR